MENLAEEVPRLAAALDARSASLKDASEGIARTLRGARPLPGAQIDDAFRAIRGELHRLPPFLAEIQHAQGAAQGRAAAQVPRVPLPPVWHDLAGRAGRLRVAVNQWPRIEALIRAQVAWRPKKLLSPVRPGSLDATRAACSDDVFDRIHRILNPLGQDPSAAALGAYPDIGLPHSRFTALAHAAYRVGLARGLRTMRFLDVGCGIGLKLLSAARFFDEVAGIEVDPGYAERARDFLAAADLGEARIAEGDASAFASYDDFDVVYLFRPIEDADAMAGLEAQIGSQLSPGALVLGPYRGLALRHRAAGLRALVPGLYVSGLSRAQAADLRRRAEHVGPSVRPPAGNLTSVWTPILAASHAAGFDLDREGPLDDA